ncbi:MAG: hypothetical protein ACK4NF_02310 [Planctomycetota bacterium]
MKIKIKKFYGICSILFTSLLLCVSQPPNYVAQSNEGKLFKEEELTQDFKLKIKFEGAERYTLQKLLTNPDCLEGDVLNLLLGIDPYTSQIDKILENSEEVEKVRNTFQKAIECAKEYLEKIQNEKTSSSFISPQDQKIQNDYDEFNKVNEKLYMCSHKVLRCLACRQDCERFGVVDSKTGQLSTVGLKYSVSCYNHCLSSITILPPPRQSKFCEKCLDNFFVTDREFCDSECNYNPFTKCATMAGEFQKCLASCKEKFDRTTQLIDYEECIQKCQGDMNKKYGAFLTKEGDKALSICFNLPLVFENIGLGKFVDFASIAGVCILPPAEARNNPGFQLQAPCQVIPVAQPPAGGAGQPSTSDTSSGSVPSPGGSGTPPAGPPPPPPSS